MTIVLFFSARLFRCIKFLCEENISAPAMLILLYHPINWTVIRFFWVIFLHRITILRLYKDVNRIIKNSLKMPGPGAAEALVGSRGNALVGGPRGQRPLGETEFSHFYSLKIGLSWTEVG